MKKALRSFLKQFKTNNGIQQTHIKILNSLEQNVNQALTFRNIILITFDRKGILLTAWNK